LLRVSAAIRTDAGSRAVVTYDQYKWPDTRWWRRVDQAVEGAGIGERAKEFIGETIERNGLPSDHAKGFP